MGLKNNVWKILREWGLIVMVGVGLEVLIGKEVVKGVVWLDDGNFLVLVLVFGLGFCDIFWFEVDLKYSVERGLFSFFILLMVLMGLIFLFVGVFVLVCGIYLGVCCNIWFLEKRVLVVVFFKCLYFEFIILLVVC